MIQGLKNLPYMEILKELNVFALEKRGPYHNIPVLEGQLQGQKKLPICKNKHGEENREWALQLHWDRFFLYLRDISSQQDQSTTGTASPEMWWNPSLGFYSII